MARDLKKFPGAADGGYSPVEAEQEAAVPAHLYSLTDGGVRLEQLPVLHAGDGLGTFASSPSVPSVYAAGRR